MVFFSCSMLSFLSFSLTLHELSHEREREQAVLGVCPAGRQDQSGHAWWLRRPQQLRERRSKTERDEKNKIMEIDAIDCSLFFNR